MYDPFLDLDQERARVGVWRESVVERKVDTFGFDLGREVRLRDRERDFVQKKPPLEVVVSGGCDESW